MDEKDCGGRFATYLGSSTAYHVYLDEARRRCDRAIV